MSAPVLSDAEWAAIGAPDPNRNVRLQCGEQEVVVSPDRALAIAALCLHGRLTRAHIYALRESGHYMQSSESMALEAEAIDLLESLLPPRKP